MPRRFEDVQWDVEDGTNEDNNPLIKPESDGKPKFKSNKAVLINKDKGSTSGKSSNVRTVVRDGQRKILSISCILYSIFFWVNILFLESFAAVVECAFRILFFSLYVIYSFCKFKLFKEGDSQTIISCLKEIIVVTATCISLLTFVCIPWSFRNYSDADDWEILPLPTLCGSVDLRRYFVFSYGPSASASNIDNFSTNNCQDSIKGAFTVPPKDIIRRLEEISQGR